MTTPFWMPVMQSLAGESVAKVTIIIGLAAVGYMVSRRVASPATRHLLLVATLLGLLAVPVAGLVMPRWNPPIAVPEMSQLVEVAPGLQMDHVRTSPAGRGVSEISTAELQTATGTESGGSSPIQPSRLVALLLTLYVAVALIFVSRLVIGQVTLQQLKRRSSRVHEPVWTTLLDEIANEVGVRRPVELFRTSAALSPVTWGTRRPIVLIPAQADSWSPARKRAVLLHELAHVARRDCLAQTIALLASAVYWFHPGIWWIHRRMSVEREFACDDRVLAAGTPAADYASHLLEIARDLSLPRRTVLAAGATGPDQLEARMRAILERGEVPVPARGRYHRWLVPSLTVLLAALITMDLQGDPSSTRLAESSVPESATGANRAATGRVTSRPIESGVILDSAARRESVSIPVGSVVSPVTLEFVADDLAAESTVGMDSDPNFGGDPRTASEIRYTPSLAIGSEQKAGAAVGAARLALTSYEPPVALSSENGTAASSGPAAECLDAAPRSDCASTASASPSDRRPISRRDPSAYSGSPLCPYFVIGMISGRSGSGAGPGFTPQSGSNSALRQARALGADGVIDYRVTPIKDANNRIIGQQWEAIAIGFTDYRNPNCYR